MAVYEVLEDGTIVPKAGGSNIYVKPDLEKEITISGQSSIVIDDLVLSANEVYDIYLLCGTSSAVDCYLKLNDISSGYIYMLQRGYWYSGQEPNMTTKGSLGDSRFLIGTCWPVGNSFHINLCNTGNGVVIDSRETGIDSTTNYVRDCSGAIAFSGDVTKLTFSLASGTFTSGRVLVYKRSKNKKPSMIYTGKELFAGNGISIDDGVISSNGFEFVGNYNSTTSMISIDIDLANYDYFTFVSHGRGQEGNMGIFFNQGLSWTNKLANGTNTKSYVYLMWAYSFSSALYICYDGSKTIVQKGDSTGSCFAYANGKPNQLTLWGESGSAEQSYISLYRRKK